MAATTTSSAASAGGLVPAQLGFLAIFNPSLGPTDETLDDQIVYYSSVSTQSQPARTKRHRSTRGKPTEHLSHEERNERLRQIGLAQGMVEFSRGFAGGKPVDVIETEKSRVVLRELEPGWWILASIDLTKITLPPRLGKSGGAKDDPSENVEYSSREVKPAALLLQDLLRAHSTFLLHHATSLSALFVRSKRPKFVSLLSRYWDLFLSTWNVMLHGNPASGVFGGIKIAACGELGMGVGEEERGSGEREVLEGFVGRIEGLVDLVVSKFGNYGSSSRYEDKDSDEYTNERWLGSGEEPGAEDGAIFLGTGALSRNSLRDIAYWVEDIYTWGEDAYGVKDSPMSTRAARRSRQVAKSAVSSPGTDSPSVSKPNTTTSPASEQSKQTQGPSQTAEDPADGVNKLVSYLKLGYGTHWSLGGIQGAEGESSPTPHAASSDAGSSVRKEPKEKDEDIGRFLIGLQGDVEETATRDSDQDKDSDDHEDEAFNSRTVLRTLTVELETELHNLREDDLVQDLSSQDNELIVTRPGRRNSVDSPSRFDSKDRNKAKKVRVVVYVSRPFIYTFLFHNGTDSLAWDALYRSLHYQLSPLRKPLISSTTYRPARPDAGSATSHIFDLVWDAQALTIQSTLPSIPETSLISQGEDQKQRRHLPWSRVEAISTHIQILNMFATTRYDYSDNERTCKTNRGWWVVWTRLLEARSTQATPETASPAASASATLPPLSESLQASVTSLDSGASRHLKAVEPKPRVDKEIFLIRRAGEHSAAAGTGLRGISASYVESKGGGWTDGASRLAQGIGVDTRKYIEGLLNLNR